MMKITLSPIRRDEPLSLERQGMALLLNGRHFDFSNLAIGEEASPEPLECDWFVGTIQRTEDGLELSIAYPIGPNATDAQRFPEPLVVSEDGPIKLP